ncbi:hypothetical protein [Streptomyces sp. NPDC088794]|uniref:hypothetical protein n=1 Tax=Streptomyces sp. NPDC088794 TaxID=3365902 RepID=UPI0038202FF8
MRSVADSPSPGRRGFLFGAAGAALALSGCSSGEDGASDGDEKSGDSVRTAQAAAAGFPVTVSGKEGAAKVTSPPERVAACGYLRDTDLALALGAPLVLATKNAVFPSGLAPWQKPASPPVLVGTAAGMPYEKIADVRDQHPELRGKTFTFGAVVGGDVSTIKSADDASAQFFGQLGMMLSPKVTSLPDSATAGRASIAKERLDLLDADVVLLAFDTPQGREEFEAQPLFKELTAVRRQSYIGLDMATAIALGFPSVLSLPYGLDAVVPKPAEAAKRSA